MTPFRPLRANVKPPHERDTEFLSAPSLVRLEPEVVQPGEIAKDGINQADNSMDNLEIYYARRAREYECVYEKPERQQDLQKLRALVQEFCHQKRVLELACGTGYWTQIAAQTALAITGVDINQEVLDIAQVKLKGSSHVTLRLEDVFHIRDDHSLYDAGLAIFWWSHIPLRKLGSFLSQFHHSLGAGAQVLFIDNRFVPGSSTPISKVDEDGNSYQIRKLENGGTFEVIKNFPNEAMIRSSLEGRVDNLQVQWFDYYWALSYRVL